MIEVGDWKIQAARLLLTFLITAGAGVHAYLLFGRTRAVEHNISLSENLETRFRWIFLVYAGIFICIAAFNFIHFLVTVTLRDYVGGPFKLGMLSLIVVVSYAAIVFGSGRRRLLHK